MCGKQLQLEVRFQLNPMRSVSIRLSVSLVNSSSSSSSLCHSPESFKLSVYTFTVFLAIIIKPGCIYICLFLSLKGEEFRTWKFCGGRPIIHHYLCCFVWLFFLNWAQKESKIVAANSKFSQTVLWEQRNRKKIVVHQEERRERTCSKGAEKTLLVIQPPWFFPFEFRIE